MYFRILSIAWGALMVLEGPIFRFLARQWARRASDAADSETQPVASAASPRHVEMRSEVPPFWAWAGGMAALVLIAVTWAMYAKSNDPYSLAATIIVTLSCVKTSQVLFNYRAFREFAVRVAVRRPLYLTVLDVLTALLGIALILLGIFVYR
jgi:hypothetical protein